MRAVQHQPELARGSAWQQPVPGPQVPGLVSGVTLACGVWLLVAPWVWRYGGTGGGFDARWNNVVVGSVLAAAGAARLGRWIRLALATAVGTVAGLWLVVAPFALAYGFGRDSTRATFNDVVIGMVLLAITVLGHASARRSVTTRP